MLLLCYSFVTFRYLCIQPVLYLNQKIFNFHIFSDVLIKSQQGTLKSVQQLMLLVIVSGVLCASESIVFCRTTLIESILVMITCLKMMCFSSERWIRKSLCNISMKRFSSSNKTIKSKHQTQLWEVCAWCTHSEWAVWSDVSQTEAYWDSECLFQI